MNADAKNQSGDIVRSGFVWNLTNFLLSQGASIVIFILLSHQLSVAVFGVFALAAVLVDLVGSNGRWAMMDAVVQRQDFSSRMLSSAFWSILAVISLFVGAFVFVAAPIATLLETPEIAAVLPVLGLSMLLMPGAAIMDAILLRDMKFRSQAIRTIAGTLAGGAAGLAVAFGPAPEWALVAQRLGASIVTLVVLHIYTRWRPTLEFSRRLAGAFVLRSAQLWLSLSLAVAHMRILDTFIGIHAGVAQLGLLRVAQRFQEALSGPVTGPIQGLWVPILSRIRDDRAQTWRLFVNLTRLCALIALPTFVGLGLVAHELVNLAFDPRYAAAGDVLYVLGMTGFLIPIGFFGNVIFVGLNRSNLAMTTSVISLACVTPVVWFAAQNGVVAAVAASYGVTAVTGIVVTVMQIRILGGSLRAFAAEIAPFYIATAIMLVVLTGLDGILPRDADAFTLAVKVAVGGLVYVGWLILVHRRSVMDSWRFISHVHNRDEQASAADMTVAPVQI